MDNVIQIADWLRAMKKADESDGTYEEFLLSEGLDLLACYRLVRDPELRRKVREYACDMARLDALGGGNKGV